MRAIWTILNEGLDLAVQYGKTANTPYAQRSLARTLFAAVEGLSFQLRRITLASIGNTDLLTEAEKHLLREERHYLDDKGRPKTSEAFLPFPQSLLFTIATYVKNHGAEFRPELSSAGWTSFKRAIEVRNSVTHPKSASSLVLSDADLSAIAEASRWWQNTMVAMFEACEQADARIRSQNAGQD